ncbi:hypothetical protein BV20DRAFT_959423, partial [Pilatotrama ljubarskyi]
KSQFTTAEMHRYEGRLDGYEVKLTAMELHLTTSRESLGTYRPVFRALSRPPDDVSAFTRPLDLAVPQGQNAAAAKRVLARLSRLHDDCAELQDQLGQLVAVIGVIFMGGAPLTAECVAEHLAKFAIIRGPLEGQVPEQNELVAALQEIITRASSTPTTLPDVAGDDGNTVFSVADLRKAYAVYADIYDAIGKMQEISDTLLSELSLTVVLFKARAVSELEEYIQEMPAVMAEVPEA